MENIFLMLSFRHFNACRHFHPQHLYHTRTCGAWLPGNSTFFHMWPLRDMKGAGPHSQHKWTSWQQLNRHIGVILRDILQLCYKCYSGQATCSSVNKTSHPASAVRYHLSKWHYAVCFSPLMTVMAIHLSEVPSLLFIHSHIRGYLTQHTSWKMNLVIWPKACLWFY